MINVTQINAALREAYEQSWPVIVKLFSAPRISGPLLIKVPQAYCAAKRRLMVVGQQTNGWHEVQDDHSGDPIEYLMNGYEEFALGKNPGGRNWTTYPFLSAAHELHSKINPEGPEGGFVWTNLVHMDQARKRPCPEVEEAVCSCGLLEKEISVLEPEVLVFLTGPYYDERLQKTFPDVAFKQLSEGVFMHRLAHTRLPKDSFRTYHPKYLRLSKQWSLLDLLCKSVG